MKGQDSLIGELNDRLDEELAAVYEYMVHAEMCECLEFNRLSYMIQKEAFVKMWHAKKLIAQVLSLGGMTKTDRQSHFTFPAKVQDLDIADIFTSELKTEEKIIQSYNNSIQKATETGDNETKVFFESLLVEDVDLYNWIKAQIVQINKIGIENYLSHQIGGVHGFDGGGDCPGCHKFDGGGDCPGCHKFDGGGDCPGCHK